MPTTEAADRTATLRRWCRDLAGTTGDLTERVVIASKGRFDRALSRPARQERGLPSGISLTKEEFIEATTDVWELPSERATRVGHPAPFPV